MLDDHFYTLPDLLQHRVQVASEFRLCHMHCHAVYDDSDYFHSLAPR